MSNDPDKKGPLSEARPRVFDEIIFEINLTRHREMLSMRQWPIHKDTERGRISLAATQTGDVC